VSDVLISPTANGTSVMRRHVVGIALRRYRENSGWTLGDVAELLECDRSKVSRLETGQRGIRRKELRELLDYYEAGQREQDFLVALANPGSAAGWWQGCAGVLDESQRDMIIMEAFATQVHIYCPQSIPVLLQTEQYTAAAAAMSTLTAQDRDRVTGAAAARRKAILDEKEPVLSVIIKEIALHQQAGRAGVMRAQLAHLADLADEGSRVTLQVLPAAAAYAAPELGGLTIFTFGQAAPIGIVHLAGAGGGIYLAGHDEVAMYASVFAQIAQAALSPAESARVLRQMAR
jgi:transcriptional regulator with XRE-family HTH domain